MTITQVSFLANGVNIGSDKLTPYSITWSNFTVGTYALTAQATDSHGARTTSPPINITVTASGGPPTVSITSPASGSQYTAPANIPITASATASSGHSISKVEFFAGATLIGTVFSAPYTFNWSNVTANTYSVTAKATDNTGAAIHVISNNHRRYFRFGATGGIYHKPHKRAAVYSPGQYLNYF